MKHPPDCACPPMPTWALREWSGRGPVYYAAQLISKCGTTRRWTCEHDHLSRDDARTCATAYLKGCDT